MNRRDFLKLGSAAALAAMLPAIQIAGDVTWTASGSIGPFRYAELYNDTETIGWWDFGDSITLADTENFTVDFAQDGVITIG